MPVISVIVPVYNVKPFLRDALDSLRAQTVQDWEALCVDDGSTDGSGAVLDDYASRDARFVVLHQANRGVGAARNVALARARGEVVAFLDPDDSAAPTWLATLLETLDDVDFAWCGGLRQLEGEAPRLHLPFDSAARYAGDAVRKRVWRCVFGYRLRDLVWMVCPGGMWRHFHRELAGLFWRAFRRTVIGDLRFDETVPLFEDALFLAAYAQRAKSLRVGGNTGYCYVIRARGAMRTQTRERLVENRFRLRDARVRIDPKMSHWRGTFVLDALDVLCHAGPRAFLRFVCFRSA